MRLDFGRRSPWLLTLVLLAGCKDDDPGASGDGSTGSTGLASGSTTVVADGGSSSGSDGGSSEETTAAPPPTEVDVSGIIQDFFADGATTAPIAGAEISIYGIPDRSTTSDELGQWSFTGLPVETFDRFVVADTDTYWGAIVPFQTELQDIEEFELSQVSLTVIDLQIQALQAQEPTVMVEDDTAVFLVALNNNTATGAMVEIDPMPEPNTFYALGPTGTPVLNSNEILFSIYPVAVFFNLPPGPEGTYEITVTHPERECEVLDPRPPTLGRHINLVRVDCLPPA